ncbi:MAG: hypothetical protein EAZ87_09230 [Nostocales cyanobacterium]|nr:MAG: hypothetical protein EAZ87_09230 [Nostocales cyanobacterium]
MPQIEDVLTQRIPLANKLEQVITPNLQKLYQTIRTLEVNRQKQLAECVNEPEILINLQNIDFSEILKRIDEELKVLDKLRLRFARKTLNIGVVGLARQGKSTLLQILSGLTDAEIPSSDRMPCTSVQSNIYHQTEGNTYAKVYFHSESSFFKEVIAPYYKQLNFSPIPQTLDDFRHQKFPEPPKNHENPAKAESIYKHLRDDYYQCLDQYALLLKPEQRQEIIKKEQIQEFVSQKYDTQGNPLVFNHLVVKKVEIFCHFGAQGVEKIGLVDMPGLGDTRLGDAERMIEALGEDVDFILFVRKPVNSGDFWKKDDIDLYDDAYQALKEKLPLNLWSFMVLNHDETNWNRCQDLKNTLVNQPIRVGGCVIANCKNPEQANQLLATVVDYLAKNINNLDRQYAESCQKVLTEIQTSIDSELEKARKVFGKTIKIETGAETFLPQVQKLIKSITKSLEDLLETLRKKRENEDQFFKAQVETVIQSCKQDTGIPSITQIEDRNKEVKGYGTTYEQYMNEVRAHLSQKFLSIDDGLKKSVEELKNQVANVLIQQGKLGALTEKQGTEFLRTIAEILPDEIIGGKPCKIKFGFQVLADFELSYRGFVQHRIRQHLDILTPNESEVLQLSKTPTAQQVLNNLKTAHQEAVYKCEESLMDFFKEPNQAAFAIVEEFLDRILRAEDVKTEWEIFLLQSREKIWESEFQGKLIEETRRKEWLDLVKLVENANQSEKLQILN